METTGAFLKNEREKQQKTLREISIATKISRKVLEAIEEDRYDLLIPSAYARGFLKLYAKELGLDPDEVVKLYAKELKELKKEMPQNESKKQPPPPLIASKYAYIVPAVIFLVVLIVYFSYKEESPEKKTAEQRIGPEASTTSVVAVVARKTAREDIAPEEDSDAKQVVPAGPVEFQPDENRDNIGEMSTAFTVKFVARELTWMKIIVDDKEPFEVMLRSGEAYRKTAGESMQIRIGNGGGLSMFFNDIPLGVLGEEGKPLNLEFPKALEELNLID